MLIRSISLLFVAILFLGLLLLPSLAMAQLQQQTTTTTPSSPTLPFIPFSLQQQETAPSSQPPSNNTGTTMATPATDDTGVAAASAIEPPLRVEAIANATQAVAPATIRFDANITGGAPPYSYSWSDPNLGLIDQDRSITLNFFEPGTFTYTLTVTDSRGKVVTDNVQIVISTRGLPPSTEGIVAPEPGGIALPPQEEGGGLLPGIITTPAASDTGGNDTGGGVTEQPLTVEIVPNATEGIAPATIAFDSKVTGGTAPYTYQWRALGVILEAEFRNAAGFVKELPYPNSFYFILNVTDSNGQTASDVVAIYIKEQPSEGGGEVLLPPETGQEGQPPGALLSQTPPSPPPPPPNDNEEVVSPPPEGETGGTPSTTEQEGEEPSPAPSNDTTGGG